MAHSSQRTANSVGWLLALTVIDIAIGLWVFGVVTVSFESAGGGPFG